MATNPLPPEYDPLAVPPPAGASPATGLLATTVGTPTQPLPPINPNVYEDDSAVNALNQITAQDSPFMQLARTAGLQTAQKRGLLNSSIAAGASQASAIERATPLATTDAQIRGARNLERLQSYFAGQRQQADITSREGMLASQLSNEQLLQSRDIAARLKMQGLDIRNQQQMQQAQIAATRQLTEMNIAAESDRLGRQLTAQEEAQIRDISAQQSRLAMQIASNEQLSANELANRLQISDNELANRLDIANLDAETRVQLQELQNLSSEQIASLNYYLNQDQIYAQSLVNLYNNIDMPAPARTDALNQLRAMRNSGVNLPAALFGLEFSWPTPTGGTTTPPPTTTPTTGGTTTPTPTTTTTGGGGLFSQLLNLVNR